MESHTTFIFMAPLPRIFFLFAMHTYWMSTGNTELLVFKFLNFDWFDEMFDYSFNLHERLYFHISTVKSKSKNRSKRKLFKFQRSVSVEGTGQELQCLLFSLFTAEYSRVISDRTDSWPSAFAFHSRCLLAQTDRGCIYRILVFPPRLQPQFEGL